ncbi:hypothetical protein NVP1063O_018 [Vibrio phage 1.063.O._10N.261.45.C7]|nr:hypothetical protein NVP1063O_018 [Vibrio phage 1.063.O._10N.261.45.C7]
MATLDTFQSDVLLGQVGSSDLGYTVEEVTVTIQAGMKMGAALELVGGKYIWVVAANVANTAAILVDPDAEGYVEELTAGDHTLVVAKRGTTIALNKVTLANSTDAATIRSAAAAFEAAGSNKVTDKVFG